MEQALYFLGLYTLGWVLGYYVSRKNHMRRGIRSTFAILINDGVLEVRRNADGSEEITPGTKSIYQNPQGEQSIRNYLDSRTKE